MATTTTHNFNLDLNLLVEEAFERCGAELRTGYDLRTATRSLNLLTIEWANRGINLWTVEEGTIPLVAGTATYDLPATTIDLMSQVIRTGTGETQSDIAISRVSNPTYASIPSKNNTGRPIQVYIDRQTNNPKITLWPIPDSTDTYTFVYWMLKRIDDAGTGVNTQHVPFRFLPCLVAGLAYYLSVKIPEAGDRTQFLKQEYEEQWLLASTEDREKATEIITPRNSYIQEIEMALKALSKLIVDKLRKGKDLNRTERKAVRDHAKAKGKTTTKDGVKVTKYPYMGKAGETVAKRPGRRRSPTTREEMLRQAAEDEYIMGPTNIKLPNPGMKKGGMLKKPTNPGLKKLPTEVRNKMGFMKKGGSVKGKCKVDGIAVRGRTRAKHK